MNIKNKLQNPFALIAQGFIGGAAIFYLTLPANIDAQPQTVPAQTAEASSIELSASV